MRTQASLCVYCRRRPQDPEWRPFCSERCKLSDLGRWLNGDYRVPGEEPPKGPPGPSGDDEAS